MTLSPVRVILALSVLALPLAAHAQGAGSLGLSLSTNRSKVASGAALEISVGVENPGIGKTVDFYFGAVLPDGDTVVFFTDLAFHGSMGRLSNLATLGPIVAGVSLTLPFTFADPHFFTYQWTGAEPTGTYTLFLAALLSGGLTTASSTPGSIVGLSTATVELLPPSPGFVEARMERNDRRVEFGGTTIEQILNVFFDAPTGTVASVEVSGGPFSMTPVPLTSHFIDPNGQTFDVFNIRQPATPFPDIDQIFVFEATPAGGGAPQVSQTAFKNTPTSQAIAITNLLGVTPDPFALAAAHLGSPLFVQWTLPSFTIADIFLSGVVYRADNTFCGVSADLATNATSGSVTLPVTCGGGAVVQASVCVFVTGVLGEKTGACHFFHDI